MRKKVFRHHLILLLLMCDFCKAVVLLSYPARVLLVPPAYDNINFCQVAGFFTSAFIEGADLAVLALAIHTALLIFRKQAARSEEGGLYQYRYYIYAINFLLPILMAALAFVAQNQVVRTPNNLVLPPCEALLVPICALMGTPVCRYDFYSVDLYCHLHLR